MDFPFQSFDPSSDNLGFVSKIYLYIWQQWCRHRSKIVIISSIKENSPWRRIFTDESSDPNWCTLGGRPDLGNTNDYPSCYQDPFRVHEPDGHPAASVKVKFHQWSSRFTPNINLADGRPNPHNSHTISETTFVHWRAKPIHNHIAEITFYVTNKSTNYLLITRFGEHGVPEVYISRTSSLYFKKDLPVTWEF